MLTVLAPAKINLFLWVTGFDAGCARHRLVSLLCWIPWYDAVEVELSDRWSCVFLGPERSGIVVEESTCMRVVEWFRSRVEGVGSGGAICVRVWKGIPHGTGLGGASSDGAALVRVLVDGLSWRLSEGEVQEVLKRVGSDSVFFWKGYSVAVVGGVGTEVEPVEGFRLPSDTHVVLLVPDVRFRTAEMYGLLRARGCYEALPMSVGDLVRLSWEEWRKVWRNTFWDIAVERLPVLEKWRAILYELGAWYVNLTGSGSVLFGLFRGRAPLVEIQRKTGLSWRQIRQFRLRV